MKCPLSIPFLKPGLALGAKCHEGFSEAWNWLIHSFWHLNLGCGLGWEEKWNGYPKINVNIVAGDGIVVDYDKARNSVVISLDLGDDEGDGDASEDEADESDGGGGAGGPENDDWSGGGVNADGSTAAGGGGADAGGDGANAGGGGRGSSCNELSDDTDNDDDDPGMGNAGDACDVVNGW